MTNPEIRYDGVSEQGSGTQVPLERLSREASGLMVKGAQIQWCLRTCG